MVAQETNGHGLSVVETAKLENLECVIAGGLKSFVEVGRALLQIRDERLYRATHMNFETYCQEKWDMTRRHAYRLVAAADVIDTLGPVGLTPANESQVRPLTRLPKDEQAAAWKEAVKVSDGKPTAAVVEKIVASRMPEASNDDEDEGEDDAEPKQQKADLSRGEKEAKEIRDEFTGSIAKLMDGGVYTLSSAAKVLGREESYARWLIRMCEVSPAIKVHRNYGRKGLVQYSFEKTSAVTAHARILQLAQQIADDPATSSRGQAAAGAIVSLLGG